MIERRLGRMGGGVHPRIEVRLERLEDERERPSIEERVLTQLQGSGPTMVLTQGMDLCDLFLDMETFECSESCPRYQECGCSEVL